MAYNSNRLWLSIWGVHGKYFRESIADNAGSVWLTAKAVYGWGFKWFMAYNLARLWVGNVRSVLLRLLLSILWALWLKIRESIADNSGSIWPVIRGLRVYCWQFRETVTDMKTRTISLAHGRVMKTTFEPLKGNTDTCPGASVNNTTKVD